MQALTRMGAKPWHNPQNSDQFLSVFDENEAAPIDEQSQLAFQSTSSEPEELKINLISAPNEIVNNTSKSGNIIEQESHSGGEQISETPQILTDQVPSIEPAEALIRYVRDILVRLLLTPKNESEIASVLQVSSAQTKVWLQKFVDEEVLEKRLKPVRYVIRQKQLL